MATSRPRRRPGRRDQTERLDLARREAGDSVRGTWELDGEQMRIAWFKEARQAAAERVGGGGRAGSPRSWMETSAQRSAPYSRSGVGPPPSPEATIAGREQPLPLRRLWHPPGRFEDRPSDRRVTSSNCSSTSSSWSSSRSSPIDSREHPSWLGVGWFVFLFFAVWSSWSNGTWYHDLHATNDVSARVGFRTGLHEPVPPGGCGSTSLSLS
jgi:hypothetical protein